jgi:hypothetical protein
MEIKEKDGRWLGRKNKKAKTLEDITDIIKFEGDFASVMGRAGRTTFHSYLGKSGNKWLEMYGVTSLLNFWGEKERLLQWAVDRAVDAIEAGEEPGTARKAHLKSLGDAGAHGTDRHALVEEYINNRITRNEHYAVPLEVEDFHQWSFDTVTFLASEKPLHSKTLWAAGTCDFVCEIDGKRYIGDLKTSNYVSYKNFIQCGAYALMHEEMGHGAIDGIVIAHMPRTGGFKIHVDMDVQSYKKDFEALVRMVKRDKSKSYELYN